MKKVKFIKRNRSISIFKLFGLLILLITFLLLSLFNGCLSPKLVDYTYFVIDGYVNKVIMSVFDSDIYEGYLLDDILKVSTNKDGEIISVDFDLELTNEILKNANSEMIDKFNNINSGEFLNSKLVYKENKSILFIPITFSSNNVFLRYLGPKIPIKIDLLNDFYSNLETRVREYGINNILIELYVTINVSNKFIFNFSESVNRNEYSQLIASKIVNAQIPEYYGGGIVSSSPLVVDEN